MLQDREEQGLVEARERIIAGNVKRTSEIQTDVDHVDTVRRAAYQSARLVRPQRDQLREGRL